MPCSTFAQRYALQNLRSAQQTLLGAGVLPTNPTFLNLLKVTGQYALHIGLRVAKPITMILKLFGLSPGTVTLWHDADSGFFTEARVRSGAPPVYHHVSDEVATQILRGELTHELEETLMAPDTYLGE